MLKAAFEEAVNFDPNGSQSPPGLTLDMTENGRRIKALRAEREEVQRRQNDELIRDEKRRQENENATTDAASAIIQAEIDARIEDMRDRVETARIEIIADIQRKERELAQVKAEMAQLETNAVLLEDGRKAYVTEDGSYVTEDGEPLAPEELEGAQFPQGAPTRYEDIRDKKVERDRTQEQLTNRREQLERLDEIEDRLDSDGDLTMDDLDDLESGLDAVMAETEPAPSDPARGSLPAQNASSEAVYSAPTA